MLLVLGARETLRLGMGLPLPGRRAEDIPCPWHADALGVHFPDEGELEDEHVVAFAGPLVDVLDQVAAGRQICPAERANAWTLVLTLAEDGKQAINVAARLAGRAGDVVVRPVGRANGEVLWYLSPPTLLSALISADESMVLDKMLPATPSAV